MLSSLPQNIIEYLINELPPFTGVLIIRTDDEGKVIDFHGPHKEYLRAKPEIGKPIHEYVPALYSMIPPLISPMVLNKIKSNNTVYADIHLVEADQNEYWVFFVDQEGANIMPYLKNADLLVSDASSSVFEFLAMDRPIVLLTNPEREKCTHYDPNGLEWRWRDLAEEVFDETELEAAIQRALKNPDKFTEKRNMYADKLFGELRQGMTGANIKIKIDELFLEQDDHKLKSVS